MVGVQRVRESSLLAGLDEDDRATVLTVVAELASNIHKHAGRGSVRVESTGAGRSAEILIEAVDEGKGIPDIALAMQDNFSTTGTLGLGLPGVRRMSDEFSITSEPGAGTCVRATVRVRSRHGAPDTMRTYHGAPVNGWDVGQCVRPFPGLRASGDLVLSRPHGQSTLLVVVDGTGHGNEASRAAAAAATEVDAAGWIGVDGLLRRIHARLAGTVGAAVGALLLDRPSRRFAYAGVGNTTASREVGESWRGISREGMLGARLPTIPLQTGTVAEGDVFVMCSDGIGSPGHAAVRRLSSRHDPNGLAREIVAQYGRNHDDASCIVARWSA